MELENTLSKMTLDDESKIYWHLYRSRPWDHMVSLFDVLSKHFDKNYDEVAALITADSSLIHNLLSEWSAKFKTEKSLVDSVLTEWAQNYMYPKWYAEMPSLKEEHERRGGPKEKYPEEAARFFCFMPFTEYFLAIPYDYAHLTKDRSRKDDPDLVVAMEHDFGITLNYPHLPLFGAALNNEVDIFPIEVMQLSIAVPLMLNLV